MPKEFLQLSANAAECRKRTESLYSNMMPSDPLPIKLIVGNNHLDGDGTSSVEENNIGTPQLNGTCDIANGHVTEVSLQADAGRAVNTSDCGAVKLSNGEGDTGMISDSSDANSKGTGELERHCSGYGEPLAAGPLHRQLSNGSVMPNGVVASRSSNLLLVAAGHEITMMVQQKKSKSGKNSNCQQEIQYCSNSPVKQQTKRDASGNYNHSVSDGHGLRTRSSTGDTMATAEANEHSLVKSSFSDNTRDDRNVRHRQPRHSSSGSTVITGTRAAELDEHRSTSQSTSSSDSVQLYSDVVSTPADFSPSSPCDNVVPTYSSHAASPNLAAFGQSFTISPSPSDLGQGDEVNHSPLSSGDAVQPQRGNSIGRGQKLRMLLNGSQH